jgi:hypothetical protein
MPVAIARWRVNNIHPLARARAGGLSRSLVGLKFRCFSELSHLRNRTYLVLDVAVDLQSTDARRLSESPQTAKTAGCSRFLERHECAAVLYSQKRFKNG